MTPARSTPGSVRHQASAASIAAGATTIGKSPASAFAGCSGRPASMSSAAGWKRKAGNTPGARSAPRSATSHRSHGSPASVAASSGSGAAAATPRAHGSSAVTASSRANVRAPARTTTASASATTGAVALGPLHTVPPAGASQASAPSAGARKPCRTPSSWADRSSRRTSAGGSGRAIRTWPPRDHAAVKAKAESWCIVRPASSRGSDGPGTACPRRRREARRPRSGPAAGLRRWCRRTGGR